jgi:hypothetical protein
MKPRLSRPAAKILSFLFLIPFGRCLATTHLLGFWCLIAAVRGNERRKDQTKSFPTKINFFPTILVRNARTNEKVQR